MEPSFALTLLNTAALVAIIVLLIRQQSVKSVTPSANRRVLIDTSALMDGRIVEIVDTGFAPGELVIPRFVVAELQLLADKSDHTKRERARYGLEIIQKLQLSEQCSVTLVSKDTHGEGVDEKLVLLAKQYQASLLTMDFNLMKVAQIEGIHVLNINDLAQTLRVMHIPGETRRVKIVSKGQDKQQGVAHLSDGTMVVVEHAHQLIGKEVDVTFTRTLQTSAGRMLFARVSETPAPNQQSKRHARSKKSRPVAPVITPPTSDQLKSQQKTQQKPRRMNRKQYAEEKLIASIEESHSSLEKQN